VIIRIRTTLLITFLAIGLVPLGMFTWMTYERTLSSEFGEVRDRHLLLAQNISVALTRYEMDVRAAMRAISEGLRYHRVLSGNQSLLEALNILNVSIVDAATGNVISSINGIGQTPISRLKPATLEKIADYAVNQQFRFTPVHKETSGELVLFVVAKSENNIVVGRMRTDYIVKLGKQVSFGVNGHAAIVDQAGNVLSHPSDLWIAEAKNLSHISPVRRMMNGETGIEQFYSPAIKENMVVGLTSVSGPGWGVMVPQPVSELHAEVLERLTPLLGGFVLSVILALFLVKVSISWLARPLENLTIDLQQQSKEGAPQVVPPSRTHSSIYELQNIAGTYNDLIVTVQNNLREQADRIHKDTVTGIGNRAYFIRGCEKQINLRLPQGRRGVLIFFDLDGFKEINDVRGHGIGDAVLKKFASNLYPVTKAFMDHKFRGVPGSHPVIGRIGGDEFALLLPIPDAIDDVELICEELRQTFPKSVSINDVEIPCQTSAGGAVYPDHGTSVDKLIKRADVALYMAKVKGKNRFELYSKYNALGGKSEILSAFMHAIEHDELILEYQPKFCVKNQHIVGVEALLRWQHPVHGTIQPNLFLPAIQQTHVMSKLGEWVVERAIHDIIQLDKTGHQLNVAVNIGVEHFLTQAFVPKLIDQCKIQKFDTNRMQIEVTESLVDTSKEVFGNTIRALQNKGFSVAIDDFGTGFSNLTRLASVPVDVIKLDRSLIREAINDARVYVIMKSAIEMAHALGSSVIVEGVETFEQVAMTQKAGADALQGFYFSKSLSPENLAVWLNERNENAAHQQLKSLQSSLGV